MSPSFEKKLNWLAQADVAASLKGMRRGLEKESLRVRPDGRLAQSAHPKALGSALTHPWLTTDYSEALLEFITPATHSIADTLGFLDTLHRYVYSAIGEEMLWCHSMPCILGKDADIPLAQYGSSNIGRMKTLYREGLGLRYGRKMQTIAGIHYNLSFPEEFWQRYQWQMADAESLQHFISANYFALIRNFQRHSWLLLYLLGASPASCASFLRGKQHRLQLDHHNTLYLPAATSLRMSNVGYQNTLQADLQVSYNSLDEYVDDLSRAIETPYPPFEAIGVQVNGIWRQINANVLQIENEYYGLIRPKRTTQRYERPTVALDQRGVEYIEMRCVDLNPFTPLGIDQGTAHFLEIFALYCLLQDSPLFGPEEYQLLSDNQQRMVMFGRDPEIRLHGLEGEFRFRDKALSVMGAMEPIAQALDSAYHTSTYSQSLAHERLRLENPALCHSARILTELEHRDYSFYQFAMATTQEHAQHFRSRPLPEEETARYRELASNSLHEQAALEASDDCDFPTFIQRYFAD